MTRRFLLRDFTAADESAFEAYRNDPRTHEFQGEEQAGPEHARELLRLFAAWALAEPRLNYQLAIVRRGEPQTLVGCCGLRCAEAAPGEGELGIELAPQSWGRYAYATEVMTALVEFGFGRLGLQAIHGATVDANSRIARLVTAFGATATRRPTPGWMSAKGWNRVEWRITKSQWESR